MTNFVLSVSKENVILKFLFRYQDGSVRLRNPNIELMDQDILYHLALGSGSHDLVEMFGDVKVYDDYFIYNLLLFATLFN